jgi:small conductance mechanosensitive channel
LGITALSMLNLSAVPIDRIMLAMTENLDAILQPWLSPKTTVGALLWAVLLGLLAWLVGRLLSLAFQRMLEQPRHFPADRTAIRFIAQLTRLVVYLFAFLYYAQLVPALQHLGSAWLASVGVASVVLGLAAQNTLGNLVAGISLLLYRPFNLGDRLQVIAPSGLETGIVESLNLGYTILRTPDNRRVVIPNSAMASQTSVNLSLTDARKLCVIPFRLGTETDIDAARKILADLARNHPKALEFVSCPVTALGGWSVTLSAQIWCADADAAGDLKNDLLESVKKRFDQAGIKLARPEVHWERD